MLKVTLISAAIAAVTVAGLGSTTVTQMHCKSTVTRVILAHYSDTYPCLDYDGNLDACDRSWTQPASDMVSLTTMDDIAEIPPWPEITLANPGADFDGYSREHSVSIHAMYDDGDYTSEGQLDCLVGINSTAHFRTLYNIKLYAYNK